MKILEVSETIFPEVKIIRFGRFPDGRGFFTESFRKSDIVNSRVIDAEGSWEIKQVNVSYSTSGVIRGFHFQWQPAMGKFVRVIKGSMIDFFLDIRKNSPTFGKISGIKLESDEGKTEEKMIWIPPGFAHGMIFLKNSLIEYFCTAEYSPTNEAGIYPLAADIDWSLCDPTLKKEFDEIAQKALISDKDKQGLTITQWQNDPRSENFIY